MFLKIKIINHKNKINQINFTNKIKTKFQTPYTNSIELFLINKTKAIHNYNNYQRLIRR